MCNIIKYENTGLPVLKEEYTKEEMFAIQEKYGVCIWFPEQREYFEEDIKALTKLKQTPDYYQLIKVKRMADIDKSVLNISKIVRYLGKVYAQAILSLAITDLCNFFNINKNMSLEQIEQTVNMIIEDYPLNCLTIADIKLCFNEIKQGKHGKIFDRMDGGVILEALNNYMDRRCTYFENKHYQQHLSTKGEAVEPKVHKLEGQARQDIINIMRKNKTL